MDKQSWKEFAAAALATARMLNLYGWDEDVASEYTRQIMNRCDQDRALAELRRVAEQEGRLASGSEIVHACRGPVSGPRYITFSRNVVGVGLRTFARRIPNDGSAAESHLRAAETLIDDTADAKDYQRLTPKMRAELKAFLGTKEPKAPATGFFKALEPVGAGKD